MKGPSPPPAPERAVRKTFVGTVASDAMEKTIVVDTERQFRHEKYGKILRRRTRLYAHDERGEAKTGDVVEIVATRPLSKLKRWRLVRIVRKAPEQKASPEFLAATSVPGAVDVRPAGEKRPAGAPGGGAEG